MNDEQRLVEKLQRIEALFAGAATPGERDAAGMARERIRARLAAQQQSDPPIEFNFKTGDHWSCKLLIALLRRYNLRPYRYPRQRYTTIMARVPRKFVDDILWPEYLELSKTLKVYFNEVTERVIKQSIETDSSEVEVRPETPALGQGAAAVAE